MDASPSFFVLLVLVAVVALVVFAVVRISRMKDGRRALAMVGGLLGIVVVGGGVLWFGYRRGEEGSLRARHRAEVVRAVASSAYQDAWVEQKPNGEAPPAVPNWLKEQQLFAPARATSRFGGFSYVKPDDQGRLAGYSSLSGSEKAAEDEAWKCALLRFRALVEANCALRSEEAHPGRHVGTVRLPAIVDQELARRQEEIELDAYRDSVNLDYGTVHRAAVLVKAEPALIEAVAEASLKRLDKEQSDYREARRKEQAYWACSIGGGFLLLLVILAIYIFLNAHTRGYYAWPLRFLALAIYLASLAGFVMLLRPMWEE
jgi:hypothetical protein